MQQFVVGLSCLIVWVFAASAFALDGRPWNVSTGNMSVEYIKRSPIGATPEPGAVEPPPPADVLNYLKSVGLVAYEDYVAWGAVEREADKWDFSQHERTRDAMHAAGLDYVVYTWLQFPPVWLREQRDEQRYPRTLMRCLEHDQETNYVSIFDPKTIEYYDRFYAALARNFGDSIDAVYACILGPYGEGNYPLMIPDWVNMGHCHEGYWCGDVHAHRAFTAAMRAKYADVNALNRAWGTQFSDLESLRFPEEIRQEGFRPSPKLWKTAQQRERWLDFITWYHQAIIDFAERSLQVTLKHFPKEKVRLKPGGNAGGVNPLAWGTYSPGYAKMAASYGVVLQPADCRGAWFGDKWIGTAYAHYGVPLATEAAGMLDEATFVRRMFSDASCGASQLFTYNYEKHAAHVGQYVHLYTGTPGDTQVAVLCPTTLYRLGGDLRTTIAGAGKLRDLTEFDVLDELLIADGALKLDKYRALVILQPSFIERPILDRIEAWVRQGGMLILASERPILDVSGGEYPAFSGNADSLGEGRLGLIPAANDKNEWLPPLANHLQGLAGVDGKLDGLMTSRRGGKMMIYNSTDQPIETTPSAGAAPIVVPPHSIWAD